MMIKATGDTSNNFVMLCKDATSTEQNSYSYDKSMKFLTNRDGLAFSVELFRPLGDRNVRITITWRDESKFQNSCSLYIVIPPEDIKDHRAATDFLLSKFVGENAHKIDLKMDANDVKTLLSSVGKDKFTDGLYSLMAMVFMYRKSFFTSGEDHNRAIIKKALGITY